jgi:hypothetical protein
MTDDPELRAILDYLLGVVALAAMLLPFAFIAVGLVILVQWAL